MYICIVTISVLICCIIYLLSKKTGRQKEEFYYCSTDGVAEDEMVREVLRSMRKDYNRLNRLLIDESQEDSRDQFKHDLAKKLGWNCQSPLTPIPYRGNAVMALERFVV